MLLLFSCYVQLFVTQWAAVHQVPLSSITSQSLLKFMSIESVMLSNHPLLLSLFTFPSIQVFSSESALLHQAAKDLELQLQKWSFQ